MTEGSLQTVDVGAHGCGGVLGEYRQRKLVLAGLVEELMTVARERHDEERVETGREVLARLADDAFQLAVVGQFSRGKSTLMNAILGGPYLPTGALPMTSVLTTVRYGSQPRACVRRAGSDVSIEVALDQLVRYVAQHSGERQELQVVAADLELPAEILRLGFSFVDTPGIGSAIAANTATTQKFLPEADAVIFVTSCDAPLSEAEQSFLSTVRRHVEKLFVVVNKADLVSSEEAKRVVRFVRGRLGEAGGRKAGVYALSAMRALQARTAGDRVLLNESGLAELERPLTHFLAGEKSRVFLEQTCGRARQALARQRDDLELAEAAQAQDREAARRTSQRFDEHVEDLCDRARGVAGDVRDQLAERFAPVLIERARAWPEELRATLAPLVEQSQEQRHSTRRQLQQSLGRIAQDAAPMLEEWVGVQTADLHTVLLAAGGEHIDGLLGLRNQVQPFATELLDLPGRQDTGSSWSSGDLPALRGPRIVFAELLRLPAVRSPGNARHPVRALGEALTRGIDLYCRQVRDGFAQAAEDWTADLGSRVETELRRTAKRVRNRFEEPCEDDHTIRLENLDRNLAAFAEDLTAWTPTAGEDESEIEVSPRVGGSASAGPCAVCEQIGMVPFDYLTRAQYELATRAERRAEHAATGGFCPLHTWLYVQTGDPVGVALTYAEIAATLGECVEGAAAGAAAAILRRFTPTADACPVCLALGEAERTAIEDVLEQLARTTGATPAISLCVGHLAAVLASEPSDANSEILISGFAQAMRRASEDLRTFAMKRHSLRRGLLNQEELTAPTRTVVRVAGHRELARPWRTDDDDRLP